MSRGRYLVARGKRTALRLALPELGRFTVGSGPEVDIRIREPGVAAMHLELFVDHGIGMRTTQPKTVILPFQGEGPNGEREAERDRTIELNPGDRVRLGRAEIAITVGIDDARSNRIWTRAYLEDQLQSALWADDDPNLVVTVLQFSKGVQDELPEEPLFDRLGADDIVASLDEGTVAILVTGVRAAEADHLSRSLARTLDRHGYAVKVGMAFPSDSDDPHQLLEVATRRLGLLEMGDHKQATLSSEDEQTKKVIALISRVANSPAHVLIQGETGTGKEVVVEALHAASPQADTPVVRVRGSELAEDALSAREGAWSRAAGSILFIDEITTLPPRSQVVLAQLLDEERPDGDRRVRVVATTNQALQELSTQGRFRTDLYYRLNQVPIEMPPLRRRKADILPLAQQFVADAADSLKRPAPKLTKPAEAQLLSYGWPGNIRELRNVMERAVLTATTDKLGTELLPPEIAGVGASGIPDEPTSPGDRPKTLRAEMAALERRRILEALEKYPTQTDAAKALDIPLRTFLNRLDALGIPRARKPAKSK